MNSKIKGKFKHLFLHSYVIFWIAVAIFPLLWIIAMALDPRNISKPTTLTLIPPGATLESFKRVLIRPYQGANITFAKLLWNSILVSGGTALLSVLIGSTAAYAFSRFKFPGRQTGMLGFLVIFMLPTSAVLAPLFVILTIFHIRDSLLGLVFAYTSFTLPFAIWNLKGYFDTVPKDLEEAALVDGCDRNMAFFRVILPLSTPALAVTLLFGFMNGWTEWMLAWTFLTKPKSFTLAMTLYNMVGQWNTPWSNFAAFSILVSLPILIVWFLLQKYIVSGLTLGGVKG